VVLLRLFRIPRTGTLYTCPSDLESLQTFHCRNRFDACWCGFDHLFVLCSGHTRRDSSHARTGNRVGFLYHQLCASHGRYVLIELSETPRFVLELSKLSYGMYLMHIFWLGLWVTVFKSALPLPTVAAIPVIATCTFICCFVTTKVISLIPGGKWIVG
jgi:hypothetical protein